MKIFCHKFFCHEFFCHEFCRNSVALYCIPKIQIWRFPTFRVKGKRLYCIVFEKKICYKIFRHKFLGPNFLDLFAIRFNPVCKVIVAFFKNILKVVAGGRPISQEISKIRRGNMKQNPLKCRCLWMVRE